MTLFSALDSLVFLIYFVVVAGYGLWVYRRKKSAAGSSASHDYFLAEGSLSWWAIGASLIASNISAEQFIGMSGSGFRIGMAIAVYELMAAVTLVIVAVFFMPVYLKNRIYTMPQFLEQRYVVIAGMFLLSTLGARSQALRTPHVDRKLFHVDGAFAFGSAVVCLLVAAIYGVWW